ncbi:alpha/beta fold hydrolase [Nocardia vaccinii]|uniref:alpha/beta fold hydrolase n=1 Tax=Nocardia vaccinii TaxID=1822 RepID=UPI001C3F8769|nr:alpha/beta hydrolase [Nocardia vaccinii]
MSETVTMVALPGTLCSPIVFDPLAGELAGRPQVDPYSWLTEPGPWDIPSISARVARYIERTYPEPVLVCGHSTGGAITLHLAVNHPSVVRGLVLADTGAQMRGHGDVDAILARVRNDWGEDLRAAVLDRSFHTPPAPRLRAELLTWSAAIDRQAVLDVLTSQRDLDLTADLTRIPQPAMVLHGRHDRARDPGHGRDLAAALPNAQFRLLDTGHTPIHEDPAAVADAVRALLAMI